jgi:hypothetical protein
MKRRVFIALKLSFTRWVLVVTFCARTEFLAFGKATASNSLRHCNHEFVARAAIRWMA